MKKKGSLNKSNSRSTLAVKHAHDYIKEKVIDFIIPPGEHINEVELAEALGMSRAPIREALNQLYIGGFVTFQSGKGFFCRKFSAKDVADLLELRADLESAAISHIGNKEARPDILAIYSTWKEVATKHREMNMDELVNADEDFHVKLAALAGNEERVKILRNINERVRFIRKIALEKEPRRSNFIGEHLKICEALMQQDQAELIKLLDYHIGINSSQLKPIIHEGLARIYAEEIL